MLTKKEIEWVGAKEMAVIAPLLTRYQDNLFLPYISQWYKPLTSQVCVKSLTHFINMQVIHKLSHICVSTIWSSIALPFVQGQHI